MKKQIIILKATFLIFLLGVTLPADAMNTNRNQQYLNEQLFDAVQVKKDIDTVKQLLIDGANINIEDEYGHTPLYYACSKKCFDIAKYLIENGANINVVDKVDWTPLIFASYNGFGDIVMLFIENGANYSFKTTKNSNTAYNFALIHNKHTIAPYLKKIKDNHINFEKNPSLLFNNNKNLELLKISYLKMLYLIFLDNKDDITSKKTLNTIFNLFNQKNKTENFELLMKTCDLEKNLNKHQKELILKSGFNLISEKCKKNMTSFQLYDLCFSYQK